MLSFIIPAYNEEALIGQVISALHAGMEAVGRPYEIIVANDASEDRTREVALAHGARVIDVNKRQISATRNAGAAAARGELLIFVDGDTIVPEAVLLATVHEVDRGAIGGGAAVLFDGAVPLYAVIGMNLLIPLFRWTRTAAGCFMFATREAFEAIGGFDERLFASEEVAFSKAMRKQGRFVVIRQRVTTSGRKVRQYKLRQLLGVLFKQSLKGPRKAWKSREGLDLWYDGKR
jgi:glycosyltransferase involved in cell wall biosynthesis